jgi:hypothetical protein
VDDAKTSSGDQSHHHEAVFNVVTGLHCVIPVVECLRYVAAQTNQQNQKRTELKKLLPHLTVLGLARSAAEGDASSNYTSCPHRKMPVWPFGSNN